METYLLKLEDVQESFIEKRPSATCKTPYVADIITNGEKTLAHSPSLGCCGIADKGRTVLTCPIKPTKKENFVGNNRLIGKIVPVKIVDVYKNSLRGEIV